MNPQTNAYAVRDVMLQEAPYPHELADLVKLLLYRPKWDAWLTSVDHDRGQGSRGLTLIIATRGYNSYRLQDGEYYGVHHLMPVPPASYDRETWQMWLLQMYFLVEQHEACEFFRIGDDHPFAPNHGEGRDPYTVFHKGTDLNARTSFQNVVKE